MRCCISETGEDKTVLLFARLFPKGSRFFMRDSGSPDAWIIRRGSRFHLSPSFPAAAEDLLAA